MEKSHYLFSSESVSAGHPDKICDQISDALVDNFLAFDPESHCAIESMVTGGQVIVAGEVKSNAYVDIQSVVRETVNKIGYTKSEYQFDGNSCGVLSAIHEQSPDIDCGVSRENEEEQGAGDQGMCSGYATDETANYMPAPIDIAHRIVRTLHEIRENEPELMPYLRPDAKSQVTVEYDGNDRPVAVRKIVVSTQHDKFAETNEEMQETIRRDITGIVIPKVKESYADTPIIDLFNDDIEYFINPTGVFIIGGPVGDCGVSGRKLVVDQYGGFGSVMGGSLSTKDASKVDRSGAYMTRYIAKNAVAAGVASRMMIQVSYAIGVAECLSFYVNTYGTSKCGLDDSEIAEKLSSLFDMRPYAIIKALNLKQPMFLESASYGQFGQEPRKVVKRFDNKYGDVREVEVELFTWEKLDAVDKIKKAFGLA